MSGLTNSLDLWVNMPPYSILEEVHQAAEHAFSTSFMENQEKISQLADDFFTYTQNYPEKFSGADQNFRDLVKRLKPYKSSGLQIESLFEKIIEDLAHQNKNLKQVCTQRVLPFNSRLAGFPEPLLYVTKECANLTVDFLRNEKSQFTLSETLEMCCFLKAQNMHEKATLLFNFHTIKYFIEDPTAFAQKLINYGYEQEAEGILPLDVINGKVAHLRGLFQELCMNINCADYLSITPPELFHWIQMGDCGQKEFFQGAEQEYIYQNYPEAFNFYNQAALLGSTRAIVKIGDCHYYGRGTSAQDYKEAFKYFSQAANLDEPIGFLAMGNCYYVGKGVLKDYNQAFYYYSKAAEMGSSRALVDIGGCYFDGTGVPKDQNKAFKYLIQAAELGDINALYMMGDYYNAEASLVKDYNEAFKYYTQGAELGDSNALYRVAEMYFLGRGGAVQSFDEAFKYYSRAAKVGNKPALVAMGDCYLVGEGVSQDFNEAFRYFSQAAERGSVSALFSMGDCYKSGKGVAQDYEKAFSYYNQAAQLDHLPSLIAVGHCYINGQGVSQNNEEAFKHWLKANQLGDNQGSYLVAQCLTFGIGIPQNRDEAKLILQDLISKDYPGANAFYNANF